MGKYIVYGKEKYRKGLMGCQLSRVKIQLFLVALTRNMTVRQGS